MARETATDWDRIRTAYITGELSLRQLARQFGVSLRQVAERSKREGWVKRRGQFRNKTATEAKKRATEEASEATALVFKIARLLLDKFYTALQRDGIELSPHHAAQWANILLALEEAGKSAEPQQIVVKWVEPLPDDDGIKDRV